MLIVECPQGCCRIIIWASDFLKDLVLYLPYVLFIGLAAILITQPEQNEGRLYSICWWSLLQSFKTFCSEEEDFFLKLMHDRCNVIEIAHMTDRVRSLRWERKMETVTCEGHHRINVCHVKFGQILFSGFQMFFYHSVGILS